MIDDEIQKNREKTRTIDGLRREQAVTDRDSTLRLRDIEVDVTVTATIETRPLRDTLIVGHPAADHGAARGAVGDQRGAWSEVGSVESTILTDEGASAITDALDGSQIGVDSISVGDGSGAAALDDTSLDSAVGSVSAWWQEPDAQTTEARGVFLFNELSRPTTEVGVDLSDGSFAARLTTSGIDPADDEELRVTVELSFDASPAGATAVTSWPTIAHAIASPYDMQGLDRLQLGTDGTAPTKSDTNLGTLEIDRAIRTTTQANRIAAITEIPAEKPNDQPHDLRELGVEDGNGTLLWRAAFGATTKDSDRPLRAEHALRFRTG